VQTSNTEVSGEVKKTDRANWGVSASSVVAVFTAHPAVYGTSRACSVG